MLAPQYKATLIILLLLSCTLMISCGDIFKLTEIDENGNDKAWWIGVEIGSGYSDGYPRFTQVNSSGETVGYVQTSASKTPYDYEGGKKTYSVRIKNKNSCNEPCGHLRIIMCPGSEQSCAPQDSIVNFGIKSVSWKINL